MVRRRTLNVVDSSAWLTYLADAPGADTFAEAIEAPDVLVVPAITIVEVFKVILRDCGESEALQATALVQQGTVVSLDATLALAAAKSGVDHELPTGGQCHLRDGAGGGRRALDARRALRRIAERQYHATR